MTVAWGNSFDRSNGINNLASKLRMVRRACLVWSVDCKGANRSARARAELEINRLECAMLTGSLTAIKSVLLHGHRTTLDLLLEQEEIY